MLKVRSVELPRKSDNNNYPQVRVDVASRSFYSDDNTSEIETSKSVPVADLIDLSSDIPEKAPVSNQLIPVGKLIDFDSKEEAATQLKSFPDFPDFWSERSVEEVELGIENQANMTIINSH